MDGNVSILRMLPPPLIGEGVRTVTELQAIPLKNEADTAVEDVNRGNGPDGDTVIVVDYVVDRIVLELVAPKIGRFSAI